MSDAAAKLEQLLITEVSAVDFPANELDGWLVMKAAQKNGDRAARDALANIGRDFVDDSWAEMPDGALPWRDGNADARNQTTNYTWKALR